jgi:hypothetical protein
MQTPFYLVKRSRDTTKPITRQQCWAELEALDEQLACEPDTARFSAMRLQRAWWAARLEQIVQHSPKGVFKFPAGIPFRTGWRPTQGQQELCE